MYQEHVGILYVSLPVVRGAYNTDLSLEPTLFWRSFFSAASCRRAVSRAVITARCAARCSSVMLALRACRVGIEPVVLHHASAQDAPVPVILESHHQSAVDLQTMPLPTQSRFSSQHLRLSTPSLQSSCLLCLLLSFALHLHFLPSAWVTLQGCEMRAADLPSATIAATLH
jgi:hypothetical protein